MLDYKLNADELARLKQEHRHCKKRNIADRIKAVYLLGIGWNISRVCEALLISDDSVRSYFNCYKEKGLSGLMKNKHLGRSSSLTNNEKQELFLHIDEHTYSNVRDIITHVSKEYDVTYSPSGMTRLLKELGFVYKKPEKVPYKIDQEAQEAFIRKYKKLKNERKEADGVYFMDATHPEHSPVPAYGWIKKGETKVLKSNPRPCRLNINGAINIDTLDMVVKFEKKINKETTKDFLEALREHQPKGWIYLICDNAGYYQSPEVQSLAKAMGIKLIYLPAYSPNLNLIERLWKFFKKKVLYNKYYGTFTEMFNASYKFFKNIGSYKEELKTLMTENFQKLAI